MSTASAPRLRLEQTISHSHDPARVQGFEGRDSTYGASATVLKAGEIPNVRSRPSVTHYVIPEEYATACIETDRRLFVLDTNTVYWVPATVLEHGAVHTGTRRGEDMTGRKVRIEDMQDWPRGAVEVDN
jgi:hypothetical protein